MSSPAAPSPVRTVDRSLSMLRRLGYSRTDSLAIIGAICAKILATMDADDVFAISWTREVWEIAQEKCGNGGNGQ
jgi:hypothetical protein